MKKFLALVLTLLTITGAQIFGSSPGNFSGTYLRTESLAPTNYNMMAIEFQTGYHPENRGTLNVSLLSSESVENTGIFSYSGRWHRKKEKIYITAYSGVYGDIGSGFSVQAWIRVTAKFKIVSPTTLSLLKAVVKIFTLDEDPLTAEGTVIAVDTDPAAYKLVRVIQSDLDITSP